MTGTMPGITPQAMTMKIYFATTVEAALDLARRELGSDALLVNSRPAPEEVRHLGRYEVVFAVEKPPTPRRQPASANSVDGPSESSILRKLLESRGVETALIRDLIYSSLRQNSTNGSGEALWSVLKREMESRIHVDSRLGKTVALVGPPGRGKTTTVVKLAVLEGLAKRTQVRILSVDYARVGAAGRLQSLASAMGIPFQLCATVGELDERLRSARGQGLTLIDTPGYGPRDFIEGAELSDYFSCHPEIDVHLTLRADAKPADALRTVQKYSSFSAKRTVFTGIDETETLGTVFSSIVQSDQSVSFFCFGQRIPQDLEAASKARIVNPIFEGWEELISAAA
jgi:flagellar biosynthesis protein FlhF